MEDRLTKKELKEQRKLERLSDMEKKTSSGGKLKWIIISIIAVLFVGFFAYSIYVTKSTNEKKQSAKITLSSSGWVTGNPTSKVTVAEFGDFQCPACRVFEFTMNQLRTDYGDKVKIVFKHFPLKAAHPNAMNSAIAVEASGLQGKFWEFHDKLYEAQDEWAREADPTSKFISYAKELKLDVDKFKTDLSSKTLEKKINSQLDEGIKIGVNSTPTVYVNGTYLGYPSYAELKKTIDALLTKK